MRGKVPATLLPDVCTRITPAYAGKSFVRLLNFRYSWDHPRLCGEKTNALRGSTLAQGSPPPMRGKVKKAAWYLNKFRITPAYAGKRG